MPSNRELETRMSAKNRGMRYPRGIFMRDDGATYDSVSHAAKLIASEIGIKATTARSRLSRAAGTGRTVYGHTWTFEDYTREVD